MGNEILNLFILTLLSFVASSIATCSQFKQVGWSWSYDAPSQNQTVSNGLACHNGSALWDTCYANLGENLTPYRGCALAPEGMMYAKGFTNLSLPSTALPALYATVSKSWTPPADWSLYKWQKVLHHELSGCFTGPWANLAPCLRSGQAGYLTYTPRLFCVNGTLEQCSADSDIGSGTAVSLCGVCDNAANEGAQNQTFQGEGPLPFGSPSVNLVLTTAEAATKVVNQTDTSNTTCNHMTVTGLSNAASSSIYTDAGGLGWRIRGFLFFWVIAGLAFDLCEAS